MVATAFAHVSDLHVGISAAADRAAARLCQALLEGNPGPVLLTRDVTHRGRVGELQLFRKISPWPSDRRPLRIFSAGSSTLQRTFRSFRSATAPACWIRLDVNEALLPELIPA